jgi:transposase InsO family protein
VYLATVIDCCTKACIGYAMADHLRAELAIDALTMAARNYPLTAGAIFHSDRGTQYQCHLVSDLRGADDWLRVVRSLAMLGLLDRIIVAVSSFVNSGIGAFASAGGDAFE